MIWVGQRKGLPLLSHPPSQPACTNRFIHLSWKNTSRETLATVHVCTVRTSQCFPSVSGKGKTRIAGPLGRVGLSTWEP